MEKSRYRIYFDTEFTGLHQYTKLISIGMVSEDGDTLYMEVADSYEGGFCSSDDKEFYQQHIKPNLYCSSNEHLDGVMRRPVLVSRRCWEGKHSERMFGQYIEQWLDAVAGDQKVELWSDLYAYDWVLFCQLWGGALRLPKRIYMYPFDLSTALLLKGKDPDLSREEFASLDRPSRAHNALYDALAIRACVEKLGI